MGNFLNKVSLNRFAGISVKNIISSLNNDFRDNSCDANINIEIQYNFINLPQE
jgi:hypothetical protein